MQAMLESLGLTRNEAKIYMYLLQKGETTSGSIIKGTKIANSRVYESLDTLIHKGFATYTVQKNGKHFSAQHPNKLRDIEAERKKKIDVLIPQLEKIQSKEESETVSVVYEGFEGFKTAFRKIIEDCPKGGEILILAFSEQQFGSKTLRTFINNMNLTSIQKKQKLKIIFDQSLKETFGKDREKEVNSEVRYMPEGYISPASIDIMGDYVYTFLWDEKPYVFMIKNKKIAESYRQYFKMMWKIAKK
jgi:sugar-specific transcriptional regulator TrmB